MSEPLLRVRDLKKHFAVSGGLFSREVGRVHAVDGVSFDIGRARRWAWWANPAAASRPPAAASCA